MGCCGHRKKQTADYSDQKWDHIQLSDFKAKGCGTGFAYGYLWFLLIISVIVYGVDSFIAVQLLAFDRWSSGIDPGIPFDVSKWIFSICIILSFVNLGYEGIIAYRIIKRGNVAESYLDPLAVRWQSIRVGSGQGWRRFLVFAELTKSKKGAEYIAIFTYFSLKAWVRVLVCSGPRQVVNAFTLKSVYEAKLSVSSPSVGGSLTGFFDKLKAFAEADYRQAIIVGGMAFTLVVWVFSVLFFIAGILFYVFFLFHWIPRADGGLSGYCIRKTNQAVLKIVTKKVNKALAKEEAQRAKVAMKHGEKGPISRTATLPDIGLVKDDSLPQMPMFGRNETMTTLPQYESRPGTAGTIELGAMDQKRPLPSRTGTMQSASSYSSRAPLVGGAADMGYGRSSPAPSLPDLDMSAIPPMRPGTSNSNRSFGRPGHNPSQSGSSIRSASNPYAPSVRSPPGYASSYRGPDNGPPRQQPPRQYEAYRPEGRPSPAPSAPPAYRNGTPTMRPGPGQPQPPPRSATAGSFQQRGPPPARGPAGDYFDRSGTPVSRPAPPQDYMNRPGTSQSQRGGPWGHDVESQMDRRY